MKAIFKKLFKRTTAALLFSATLIAVFAGVVGGKTPSSPRSVAPIVASADEKFDSNYDNYAISDSNYAFEGGASVLNTTNEDGSHRFNYLSFVLKLKNPEMRNFNNEMDITKYTFTLYRKNDDGKNYPLYSYIITRQNSTILGIQHNITDFGGSFDLAQSQSQGLSIKTYDSAIYDKFVEEYKDVGHYKLQSAYVTFGEKKLTQDIVWEDNTQYFDYPYLRFILNVPSLDDDYFVRFNYEIKDWIKDEVHITGFNFKTMQPKRKFIPRYDNGAGGDDKDGYSGTIDSDIRSSKGVLENMQSVGALEEEFPDVNLRAQAEAVLQEKEIRRITLSYLAPIGNTTFAERVEKTVQYAFPSTQSNPTTLNVREICSKFDIPINVLGSNIDEFKMNTSTGRTDYYEAIYGYAVYITPRTASGNEVDSTGAESVRYALALTSFEEYYEAKIDDRYLTLERCAVIYNNLRTDNADLQGYKSNEVYGYWGFALVPKSLNLRDIFSRVFNTQTTVGGVRMLDEYSKNITMTDWNDYINYIKSLNDYQYHLYEIFTSAFTTAVTPVGGKVTHYIFYADVSEDYKNAYIGENGAENANDSQSAMEKTTEEVTKELLQMSMELNEQLQNSASGVATPWESRGFRVVFGIATVGAVLLGGVYLYVRYGGVSGSDVHVNIDSDGTSTKKKSPAKKKTTKKK